MSKQEGLIIHFDEEQRNDLIKSNEENLTFSDALSVYDWEIKQLQVVLISFTGKTIDFISLASKGSRVATAKSRVEFSDLVDLNSVPLDKIEILLEPNTKLHFMRSSSGRGGRIPNQTWTSVLSALKNLRPNKASEIDRLTALKEISRYHLTGAKAELFLQQREALGAALDIFSGTNQLRKNVLKSWAPKLEEVTDRNDDTMEAILSSSDDGYSFMNGLQERYIQEESAIQHDLFNWEGVRASLHHMGVSRFTQGNRVLEIVYANKNSLEHTLGIDLIYYNKSYHSFVLVQYKLMKEKNDKEGYFYRPDEQLEKEIKRMNEFHNDYPNSSELLKHEFYRLNSDGFLFKLVPSRGLQAASEKLISGMYIPREYMMFLLGKNGPKGEKGGRIISFNNSPRYLTNTEFSSSVNRGWIGSASYQSEILSAVIASYLETGRAIMVAVEVDTANNSMQPTANASAD